MKNKRDTEFLTQSFIAHRGLHNINENIPENTLKAFKNAIKNNYAIELDVHILKDGKVIVFHDKTLFRMTGVNKKIKDMNYDEIKCLKLKNTSENIPLLKEVLKLVAGKVPLIIELKSSNKVGTLEKEVMKLLENYNTVMEAIIKAKPAAAKGQYIKSAYVTTTMGPGILLNQK